MDNIEEQLPKLNVQDLKEVLSLAKLSKVGRKQVLIDRILGFLKNPSDYKDLKGAKPKKIRRKIKAFYKIRSAPRYIWVQKSSLTSFSKSGQLNNWMRLENHSSHNNSLLNPSRGNSISSQESNYSVPVVNSSVGENSNSNQSSVNSISSVTTIPMTNINPPIDLSISTQNASRLPITVTNAISSKQSFVPLQNAFDKLKPKSTTTNQSVFYFKSIPKFEFVEFLLKPTKLDAVTEQGRFFYFAIPSKYRTNFKDYKVLLRCCRIDQKNPTGEQVDGLVPFLCIDVNGTTRYRFSDQSYEKEIEKSPLDITSFVNENSSNSVNIRNDENNVISFYHCGFEITLVKVHTSVSLLNKLKSSENVDANFTHELVKSKFRISKEEELLKMDYIDVDLICPITKSQLRIPLRSVKCQHLECFDGQAFIELNLSKDNSVWKCPICKKNAEPNFLMIDSLFETILTNSKSTQFKVRINKEGKWSLKDAENKDSYKRVVYLDSDSDEDSVYYLSD